MQISFQTLNPLKRYNFIEIELRGEIPEGEERFFISFFISRRKTTMWDVERVFLHASENPNIDGVLIKLRDLSIGLARAEGLRRAILQLRQLGKKVFVYIESGGNVEYLIASAADKIVTPQWSLLNLIGLKAEVTFFKEMLDKIGIEAETKGLGKYKSAAETFTRNSMSEPHRAMMDSILDDMYDEFVKRISEGRGLKQEEIKSLINSGPFMAKEALKKGIVDELKYEDELDNKIKEVLGKPLRKIRTEAFLRIINFKDTIRSIKLLLRGKANVIALISDSGMITLGESRGNGTTKTLGSQTMISMLKRVAENKSIKALVLRILSPGGSGIASDLIKHQLKIIAEKKPVIISMSDVSASGGYLIAIGGTKIIAEPFTLTGSIGVMSGKLNLRNILDKLGITKEWITRGDKAMMFSSSKEFTPDEGKKLDEIIRSMYENFVGDVAAARKMDIAKAEEIAQGRVWTGKQAKELGLVDELGGIREAIDLAKKEAGIPEKDLPLIKVLSVPKSIQISPLGRSFGWAEELDGFVEKLKSLEREKALTILSPWIDVK